MILRGLPRVVLTNASFNREVIRSMRCAPLLTFHHFGTCRRSAISPQTKSDRSTVHTQYMTAAGIGVPQINVETRSSFPDW